MVRQPVVLGFPGMNPFGYPFGGFNGGCGGGIRLTTTTRP